jgi:hypothetical protein
MAVHHIAILGSSTVPDASGNVWQEPWDVLATNDMWPYLIWRFKNAGAVKISLYGSFRVPHNFVGSALIVPEWTTLATTGNAVWGFAYRVVTGSNVNSLDQTGNNEAVSVTAAAPGAAARLMVPTITPTSANFAADARVQYQFSRDKSSGSDTLAADAALHGLNFQYADA